MSYTEPRRVTDPPGAGSSVSPGPPPRSPELTGTGYGGVSGPQRRSFTPVPPGPGASFPSRLGAYLALSPVAWFTCRHKVSVFSGFPEQNPA